MSKRDDDHIIEGWSNINFKEVELGEIIGGGGAGVIYEGNI